MPNRYYINRNNKIRGPFSEERIRELHAEGKLRETDFVSTRKDGGWKPVDTVLRRQKLAGENAEQRGSSSTKGASSNSGKSVWIGFGMALLVLTVAGIWMTFHGAEDVEISTTDSSTSGALATPSVAKADEALLSTAPETDPGFAALLGQSAEWEWSPPEPVIGVVEEGLWTPTISMDGLTLAVAADRRAGGLGTSDIWVSRRKTLSDPWPELTNPGPGINSPVSDWSPSLSHDGSELYFHSHRSGGNSGDIWLTEWDATALSWKDAVNLSADVNTTGIEQQQVISPDGLELIVWSNGPNSRPGGELWQHRRQKLSQPFGPGTQVWTANPSLKDMQLHDIQFYSPDSLMAVFSLQTKSSGFVICSRETATAEWKSPCEVNMLPNEVYDVTYSSDAGLLLFQGRANSIWQMRLLPKRSSESMTSGSPNEPKNTAVDDFEKDRAESRTDLNAENPAVATAASDKSGPSSAQREEAIAKAPETPAPMQTGNPAVPVAGAAITGNQADFPCQQAIAERDSRPDYGPLKTEMNRRIRNLRSLLTKAGVPDALIVAGKIELPETDAENIDASIAMQCELFSGGYFVTALGEITRPLFVVANGYLPTEIRIPPGMEGTDNVIHIAPIALQPVTKSNESVVSGNVSLRPPGPMSQIHLSFQPIFDSKFNLPDAMKSIESPAALNPAFRVPEAAVSRDGSFRKNAVSPMPHRIVARCFGYEVGEGRFDGKRLIPENLFLEAVPKYLLETLHATEKSSDNKSVALVSQSSTILDGKWFQIARRSPEEVDATTLIIEPSRMGLQWAALDPSSMEKPWKQVSSLTMVEFTKEEVIEFGRSYFIRGTENKDDRLIFTLTAPPTVEVAESIQEIAVDKIPAQFRSQYVDKLESDLQQVRQVPRETPFGLAGLVTAGGTTLQSASVAIGLHGSGATSNIRSEGIDGTIAFAAASPSQVMGGASAVLSVRAFGYEPIEEVLSVNSGKLLCIDVALKPVATESQSQLELNVVDTAGKPVPLTEVTLSFVGVSAVWSGFSFTELTWTQKTDRLGKVVFPGLSSDWYKFVVGHKSLRPVVRSFFLESSMQNVQTVQLRPRRMVRIEFVTQPDGTGKFTGEAINAEIQEGGTIPIGKTPDTDGQMTLSAIGLYFGFTKSDCWIVDVGKRSLDDVTDALIHQPKQVVAGFGSQNPTRAECRIGHVYVIETPSKQHIKFRVTEMVEPQR